MLKKLRRSESKVNPGQAGDPADHDERPEADNTATKQPPTFQLERSKSCGEGRASAPSDELTLRLPRPNAAAEGDKTKTNKNDSGDDTDPAGNGFTCGLLCLFWPGFGKGKQVNKAGKEEPVAKAESISRTVSLEKFECGSWASSAICRSSDEAGESKHYFDLPMELIRNNVADDSNSPVTAAFVFDKDRKGILRKNSSKRAPVATKSDESPGRHVRFSTSSPDSQAVCISPRLLKAREDFCAFLEAQSK